MDNKSFIIGLVICSILCAYDVFLDVFLEDVFGPIIDRLHKKRLEKKAERGKKCK